jgi:hypothetical protein
MAEIVPRHFAVPFRFTVDPMGGQGAATTVQGTTAEIADCVETCVRTVAGQRLTLPSFGRPETLEFAGDDELAASQLEVAIDDAEPRAQAIVDGNFDLDDPAVLRLQAMYQLEEIQ